jgi:hypothetical protein
VRSALGLCVPVQRAKNTMLSCRVCLSAEHQSVCDARNKARKGSNAPKLQQPLCNILCTPRRLGRPWPLGCGWGSPTKPAELELGLWHDGFVESSLCSLDHSLDHARCSQGLQPLPSQPASLPRRYSRPHVSRRGDLVWPRHDGCVHPQLGPSRTLDHGGSCFARPRQLFCDSLRLSITCSPASTHALTLAMGSADVHFCSAGGCSSAFDGRTACWPAGVGPSTAKQAAQGPKKFAKNLFQNLNF